MRLITFFLMVWVFFSAVQAELATNDFVGATPGWWYVLVDNATANSDFFLFRDTSGSGIIKTGQIEGYSIVDSFQLDISADLKKIGKDTAEIVLAVYGDDKNGAVVVAKKEEVKYFFKWGIVPMKERLVFSLVGKKTTKEKIAVYETKKESKSVGWLLMIACVCLLTYFLLLGVQKQTKSDNFAFVFVPAFVLALALALASDSVLALVLVLVLALAFVLALASDFAFATAIILLIVTFWIVVGPVFVISMTIASVIFWLLGYFLTKPKNNQEE